jgi:hypothetical protein
VAPPDRQGRLAHPGRAADRGDHHGPTQILATVAPAGAADAVDQRGEGVELFGPADEP